ncbi:hypothetical protein AC578_10074 [Pseudocercospora eumusae]|uniref:Uncharacterized protein n=1 Tax=Pseudocercospora eumusae TaxID=321146 RepID=A0A139H8G6_9PEZI|nr:hypothetical protein AC578_10074 [Pseudocercospora eumusae]
MSNHEEVNIATRAPLGVLDPNSAPAATSIFGDVELTSTEQSRIIVALSMRKDDLNDVRMPFEDCETLAGLLNEIVEGPYRGLVKSKDAIRAVWLSADCDEDVSKLYLRTSKQSSAESYRQFLGREVKSRLKQEGSTCVISVVVEV